VIPLPTKGLGDFLERVLVSIPRQRSLNKLWAVQRQMEIIRKMKLVRPDQERELAEMLLHGANVSDALSEMLARAQERNGAG
jgi:hypothetical protein